MNARRPAWMSRRQWCNPAFHFYMWRARRVMNRCVETPCREGNCVELIDPKTGEDTGGWGPVGCPCQDVAE